MLFRLCLVLGLQLVIFVFSIGLVSAAPHKGATYPTKTFPPADCSDYIDPKDSTKFSHCEKLTKPPSNKWQGYIEFMGKPGTARSIGQSDLFVPLVQDENDMTFFNLRGQLDDDDNDEFNLGLGHRHMFEEWIIGGYGYYDRRFLESGNEFYQATFGLEALSETWDFRANGYIPESEWSSSGNEGKLVESLSGISGGGRSVVRAGGQINVAIDENMSEVFERSLPGLDLEVGVRLPVEKFTGLDLLEDTRLYVSGYHFMGSGDFESVTGPRLRLETRLHDIPGLGSGSRLLLGVETQYDELRGNQTFGLVSVRIPFGGWTPNRPPLKGLERRMMEPVVRDIDVVTSTTTAVTSRQELLPALDPNGDEYPAAVDIIQGESETDREFQTRITTAANGLAEGALAFVQAGNGNNAFLNWLDFVAPAGVTLVSAGSTITLGYVSPTTGAGKIGYSLAGTPLTIRNRIPGPCDTLITMADGSRLHGWTLDANRCDSGVSFTTAGDYSITGSTIFGGANQNINLANGTLHVDDLGLYGSARGIHINGGTAMDGVPRLRGFAGTAGTIHSAGRTGESRLIEIIGSTFATGNGILAPALSVSQLGTLTEDQAVIAGVTVDADGYDHGIQINRVQQRLANGDEDPARKDFFITRTTVRNGLLSGIRIAGQTKIGIRDTGVPIPPVSYLYLTDSLLIGSTTVGGATIGSHGIRVDNGAGLFTSNIDIRGYDTGLSMQDSVPRANHRVVTIKDSRIANNGTGVSLTRGGFLTIADSVISDSLGHGISLFDEREPAGLNLSTGGLFSSSTTLSIFDSTIRGNVGSGVHLVGSSVTAISGTNIHANDTGIYAIALRETGTCESNMTCSTGVPDVTLSGINRIYSNITGIFADYGSDITISSGGTVIENNALDGIFAQAGSSYSSGEPLTQVNISGATAGNAAGTAGTFVRNNGRDGISVLAGSSNANVSPIVKASNILITGNARYGLHLRGGEVFGFFPPRGGGDPIRTSPVAITGGSITGNGAVNDILADTLTVGNRTAPSFLQLFSGFNGIDIDRARIMVVGNGLITLDRVDINAPAP